MNECWGLLTDEWWPVGKKLFMCQRRSLMGLQWCFLPVSDIAEHKFWMEVRLAPVTAICRRLSSDQTRPWWLCGERTGWLQCRTPRRVLRQVELPALEQEVAGVEGEEHTSLREASWLFGSWTWFSPTSPAGTVEWGRHEQNAISLPFSFQFLLFLKTLTPSLIYSCIHTLESGTFSNTQSLNMLVFLFVLLLSLRVISALVPPPHALSVLSPILPHQIDKKRKVDLKMLNIQ